MATLDDLTPCTYLPVQAPGLLAVGWLGRDSKFGQGPVGSDFFEKLQSLASNPWQPFASAGFHFCEVCQFTPPSFGANLFVPHDGLIYVAPAGILHYIAAHWYKPPGVFIEAVLQCPPMNSIEYKKALLANGGRPLVKAMML
jgi:hypothetical protein